MFPLVGSGRFITAPAVTEDGTQCLDPLVLLENNPENGPVVLQDVTIPTYLEKITDKRIIQWMLTLHQIGL